MPTKPKPIKPEDKKEDENLEIGAIHEELEVPVSSEIVFRKIWTIKKFQKSISKRDFVDSPRFRCSVNGMGTIWNISIRFWKGEYTFYKRQIYSNNYINL